MKFRKRKDVKQRSQYKLKEPSLLLNSYWKSVSKIVNASHSNPKDHSTSMTGSNNNKQVTMNVPQKISESNVLANMLKESNLSSLEPTLETKLILHGVYDPMGQVIEHTVPNSKHRDTTRISYGKSQTITKIHSRCVQTNRTRSVNRLLKISRHQLRRLAVKGNIPGSTKATW